jgi:hypothetical protein
MSDRPKIIGHVVDCDCWECVEQRKFDARVSAHIRDPMTLTFAGCIAVFPALIVALVVGGLARWLLGIGHVMVTALAAGLLVYVCAFGFTFLSIVLSTYPKTDLFWQ